MHSKDSDWKKSPNLNCNNKKNANALSLIYSPFGLPSRQLLLSNLTIKFGPTNSAMNFQNSLSWKYYRWDSETLYWVDASRLNHKKSTKFWQSLLHKVLSNQELLKSLVYNISLNHPLPKPKLIFKIPKPFKPMKIWHKAIMCKKEFDNTRNSKDKGNFSDLKYKKWTKKNRKNIFYYRRDFKWKKDKPLPTVTDNPFY